MVIEGRKPKCKGKEIELQDRYLKKNHPTTESRVQK